MPEKSPLILSDRSVVPTDDYIFSLLGDKKELWKSIIGQATVNNPGTSGSWNYYNDGKQWLFKLVYKKKTIFWSGIMADTFRVTFYFGDKAEAMIIGSELPESIKEEFRTGKRYGLIRAISINVYNPGDVENILRLIAIKHKIK
jgi:hypothetical protein